MTLHTIIWILAVGGMLGCSRKGRCEEYFTRDRCRQIAKSKRYISNLRYDYRYDTPADLISTLDLLRGLDHDYCQGQTTDIVKNKISHYGDKYFLYIGNPNKHRYKFFWKRKSGLAYKYPDVVSQNFSEKNAPLLLVNGGIFEKDLKPLGLYIESGEELSDINLKRPARFIGNFYMQPNGVFFVTNRGEVDIKETSEFIKVYQRSNRLDATSNTTLPPVNSTKTSNERSLSRFDETGGQDVGKHTLAQDTISNSDLPTNLSRHRATMRKRYTTPQSRLYPAIEHAIQSGPMLLINGKINRDFSRHSKNLFMRSGIGVAKDRSVVIILSEEVISFYRFAKLFKKHGAYNALYLDGGPTAVMYEPNLGQLGGKNPLVTMIGVLSL